MLPGLALYIYSIKFFLLWGGLPIIDKGKIENGMGRASERNNAASQEGSTSTCDYQLRVGAEPRAMGMNSRVTFPFLLFLLFFFSFVST